MSSQTDKPEGLGDLVREHLDVNATDTWEEAVAAVMVNTETDE